LQEIEEEVDGIAVTIGVWRLPFQYLFLPARTQANI
jgi:hypothetical protein